MVFIKISYCKKGSLEDGLNGLINFSIAFIVFFLQSMVPDAVIRKLFPYTQSFKKLFIYFLNKEKNYQRLIEPESRRIFSNFVIFFNFSVIGFDLCTIKIPLFFLNRCLI